jgi:hypothetical protein
VIFADHAVDNYIGLALAVAVLMLLVLVLVFPERKLQAPRVAAARG